MRTKLFLVTLALVWSGLAWASVSTDDTTREGNHNVYFSEDWENGMGVWSATNGVWEVGAPTYGTSKCRGANCAATNLDGAYPYQADSYLQSPLIELPEAPLDGALWVSFWHWFNFSRSNGTDYGKLYIKTEDSGWVPLGGSFTNRSMVWNHIYYDISDYAGQTIILGFRMDDVRDSIYSSPVQSSGWYIDDIKILDGAFPELATINRFDKAKDTEWDGWYASNGIWELGKPTNGTSSARSPHMCFGTNLGGDYPEAAYSRLVSPQTTLPATPVDGKLYFSFQYYSSLSNSNGTDQAITQIHDGANWITLKTMDWRCNHGSEWHEVLVDISAYAGQTVRIGFLIDDDRDSIYSSPVQSAGFYIDDVQFSQGAKNVAASYDMDNLTPDWTTSRDVWEVGAPTNGPGAAHSGDFCWGTNLDGNYPYGTLDYLYTPSFSLPNASGLYVCFWHWFSFSTSNGTDYGLFQIYDEDQEAYVNLNNEFHGSSGGWTQLCVSLDDYAGKSVRFRFQIGDRRDSIYSSPVQSSGWYIDDFELVGLEQHASPPAPYVLDVDINAGPAQLNFPHTLDNIDKVIIYGSPVYDFLPTLGNRLAILPATAMSWADTERTRLARHLLPRFRGGYLGQREPAHQGRMGQHFRHTAG
jgi:hypothetical protein